MKMILASAAWWFGIIYISVSLVTNGSSQSQTGSVNAFTGEDVILPCHLTFIPNLIVEWTRSDQTLGKVHLYKDGQDSDGDQLPMYKGRTSLFTNELIHGNVSLKLSKVTMSDVADYKCRVPTHEGSEKSIKLQVAEARDVLNELNKQLEKAKEKKDLQNTKIIDSKKTALIQHFTKVMLIADLLNENNSITKEDHTSIRDAGTRENQMKQLYQVLDKRGVKAKSAFFTILMEEEPDFINLAAGSTWTRGQITGVIIAVIVAVLAASAVV